MQLLNLPTTYPLCKMEFYKNSKNDEWDYINNLHRIIQQLEIYLVKIDFREAATMHISAKNMIEICTTLNNDGLYFTPIKWVKNYAGFLHRFYDADKNDPNATCYGVVTKTKHRGIIFRNESLCKYVNHDFIGGMLGYPECCRKFFKKVWAQGYYDPIWQQAINSDVIVKKNNNMYFIEVKGYKECVAFHRYWGIRISFHIPCSFTCENTKILATKLLCELQNIDKRAKKIVEKALSLDATWDVYRGTAVVHTPFFRGMAQSVPCANVHSVYYSCIN